MYSSEFAQQIVNIQKSTIDSAYQIATIAQERMEMLANLFFEQAGWIPVEGKRVFGQWSETAKLGQRNLKETIDKNFDALLSTLEAK